MLPSLTSSLDWTGNGTGGISGGSVVLATGTQIEKNLSGVLLAGKMYRVTMTVSGSGYLNAYIGGAAVFNYGNGTRSATLVAGGTSFFIIQNDSGAAGSATITGLTLQELCIWQPGMDWLGPELWNSASATLGSGWSLLGDVLTTDGTSSNVKLAVLTAGKTYQFGAAISGGVLNLYLGSSTYILSATGAYSWTGSASDPNIYIQNTSTGVKTAASISVREQLYTFQQVLLPANVPRFAYDPVTFAPLGLLIEPQRTNWVLYSENLSNAGAWQTVLGASINRTPVQGVGPDGGPAWRVNVGADGGASPPAASAVYHADLSVPAGPLVSQVWARAVTGTVPVRTTIYPGPGNGTETSTANITLTTTWQRITNTTTAIGGSGSANVAIRAASTGGVVGDIYITRIQLEAGTEPTSYTPTSGAAATRAGEPDAVLSGAAFTALFGSALTGGWTLFADFTAPTGSADDTPILSLNTNTSNRIELYLAGRVNGGCAVVVDNVVTSIYTGVGANAGRNKAALSFTGTTMLVAMNGSVSPVLTFATLPAANKLQIGADSFGRILGGAIASARVFRRAMTATELQALTR
jgi:hypothetical protein